MMKIEKGVRGANIINTFKARRFGEVNYKNSKRIKIPKGIFGFSKFKDYIIVEKKEDLPFLWLQSILDPDLAFLIVDPLIFFPDYLIIPEKSDLEELRVSDAKELKLYVIVTVPSNDFAHCYANLIAPLVLRK